MDGFKNRVRTDFIVVHCSKTPVNDPAVLKAGSGYQYLDRKHRELGAFMCGYHAVIERDGTVIMPRHHAVTGNHCPGVNSVSYSICLIGGADADGTPTSNYSDEQREALLQTVEAILRIYPTARVVGHYEVSARKTLCPSFDVADWWWHVLNRKKLKETSDAQQPRSGSPNPVAPPVSE